METSDVVTDQDFIERTLTDNDLADCVREFVESGAPCWHIDRHVEVPEGSREVRLRSTCAAAIALARRWNEVRAQPSYLRAIDNALTDRERLYRHDGVIDEQPGCWIVELLD